MQKAAIHDIVTSKRRAKQIAAHDGGELSYAVN